jgi:hypothetical protein
MLQRKACRIDAIAADYVGFSVRHQRAAVKSTGRAVKFPWPNAAIG